MLHDVRWYFMNEETIAVRAYTIPKKGNFVQEQPELDEEIPEKVKIPIFNRIIVIDTESTIDLYQNLKFGYFEIYQYDKIDHRGIFYDSITVRSKELAILEKYSNEKKIQLYTIEEFRKIFLHEVYDLETLCIGFNLPFDLTRIAIKSTNTRRRKKEAFSLEFSKRFSYARLYITHATSTLSFIQWGNTKNGSKIFRGNFVDLRTLCHALTDEKHSLESACKAFNTSFQKIKTQEHGKITSEYIDYCINDVKSTYSLYQNAKNEFDTYGLEIPITKAYTPASIGKEFLKLMGITSFADKNPKFSSKVMGHMMTTY